MEPPRTRPSLAAEQEARRCGARRIAGLDEVGRGALAGPVVAAAVILGDDEPTLLDRLAGVRDSKQVMPADRVHLSHLILQVALGVGIGMASPLAIDALGIARATELAMLRAVRALPNTPDFLLTDGFPVRACRVPQRAIVHGDQGVLSIAAASIVAKVYRDALMIALGARRPEFGFDAHKGYGTQAHLEAIQAHGVTVHHRLTWAPAQGILPRLRR